MVAKTDFSHLEQTSRWRVVGQSLETDQPAESVCMIKKYMKNRTKFQLDARQQNSPLKSAHHLLRSQRSQPQSDPPSACLAPKLRSAVPLKELCDPQGLDVAEIP